MNAVTSRSNWQLIAGGVAPSVLIVDSQLVPQGTEGVLSSASGSAIARVVLPAQYDPVGGEDVLSLNENVSKTGPVYEVMGGSVPNDPSYTSKWTQFPFA